MKRRQAYNVFSRILESCLGDRYGHNSRKNDFFFLVISGLRQCTTVHIFKSNLKNGKASCVIRNVAWKHQQISLEGKVGNMFKIKGRMFENTKTLKCLMGSKINEWTSAWLYLRDGWRDHCTGKRDWKGRRGLEVFKGLRCYLINHM